MLVCVLRSSVNSVADNSIAAITSGALLESDFLNACFFPCFLAQRLCIQAYALDITYLILFCFLPVSDIVCHLARTEMGSVFINRPLFSEK